MSIGTEKYIPFHDVVVKLHELCKERRTGALFITTESNRSAQLRLNDGEIVFIFYSGKLGEKAIGLLTEVGERCKYRFQEGTETEKVMGLPPTTDLLKALAGSAEPAADASEPSDDDVEVGVVVSDDQFHLLEEAIARYLGPMAGGGGGGV